MGENGVVGIILDYQNYMSECTTLVTNTNNNINYRVFFGKDYK
jgi:hypothetical protein